MFPFRCPARNYVPVLPRGLILCVTGAGAFISDAGERDKAGHAQPRPDTPRTRPGLTDPRGRPADLSLGPCAGLELPTAMAPSEGRAVRLSRGPRAALNARPVPLPCTQMRVP